MRSLLAYSKDGIIEEKLTLRIKADASGNIYVPTAGYSPEGGQNCKYNWKVILDGVDKGNYSGVGSATGGIRVGYGLAAGSIHTVTIKPVEDEFGWLRAFGYRGTSYASSLINIISDKSYKGFAVNEIFSGDYFKAYQYYGCNNLVNTDEELLPDTLEIIGNNYRYYEYAGCVKLVSNAEEKILKTVRVIGDNYRAYQYQNCTGINKINMRAINWASVGTNYRFNQYSGIGTDRNLVNIYIEGGIEEGGSWGLVDSNVKGVYVYKDLVNDYKTKLSGITSSKIQKNSLWDNLEYEFIEYIGLADSTGKIRIPVGGYSTGGSQNCAYDWMVSIDGGEEEEITGTGSATYVSVGSGLTEGSEHRVIVKPATIGWGWGRAFGYYNTGAEGYIKEIIHDSYKCYANSRTGTGAYYKYCTYKGCTNLINSYEKLPTSVTTVGNYYMKQCYMGCTSLESAFWEIMHRSCTLGVDFRYEEYANCSSLGEHQGIVGYIGTYPTNYRKGYFENSGNDLDLYITRKEELAENVVQSLASLGYTSSYSFYTVVDTGSYNFSCEVYEGGSSGGTELILYKNGVEVVSGYAGDYKETVYINKTFNAIAGDILTIRVAQLSYGSGSAKKLKLVELESIMGLNNANVNGIYCYAEDIFNYQNSLCWYNIDDEKFKGWYYQYKCFELMDIDRYTKLLATIQMPDVDDWLDNHGWGGGGYNRGIAINRKIDWDKLAIGVTEYGKDSTGNNRVGVLEMNITTQKVNGDRVITGVTPVNKINWGGGNSSGGVLAYANAISYDTSGNIYGNYAYYSGYGYFGLWGVGSTQGSGNQTYASAISRNGKYIWGNFKSRKMFHSETKNNFSSFVERADNTQYGNLIFSDDGLTMISGNNNWSLLKQYRLSSPRLVNTAVDTGKSLSIKGQVSMSFDGKYLFRFDDTTNTLYQYTYE